MNESNSKGPGCLKSAVLIALLMGATAVGVYKYHGKAVEIDRQIESRMPEAVREINDSIRDVYKSLKETYSEIRGK